MPISPVVSPLDSGTPIQRRGIAIAEVIICSSVPTQIFLQGLMVAAGWQPLTNGVLSLSFVATLSLVDTATTAIGHRLRMMGG